MQNKSWSGDEIHQTLLAEAASLLGEVPASEAAPAPAEAKPASVPTETAPATP
jgi:hypothetical protein